MTDTDKLKEYISKSGLKLEYLAKKLEITRASLSMKVNNHTSFKAEEMYKLSDMIGLSDEEAKNIFFNGM